jgi:hypothetical protein
VDHREPGLDARIAVVDDFAAIEGREDRAPAVVAVVGGLSASLRARRPPRARGAPRSGSPTRRGRDTRRFRGARARASGTSGCGPVPITIVSTRGLRHASWRTSSATATHTTKIATSPNARLLAVRRALATLPLLPTASDPPEAPGAGRGRQPGIRGPWARFMK